MTTETCRLATTGLHCPSCSMLVQMEVGNLSGVVAVSADHRTGLTEVAYDPAVVSPAEVVAVLDKLGYTAELVAE